ncbi:MAG: hypothetical protein NWF14_07430 [Candidatus Bathyarchaeota archaeon]|nr:hypothetical protein [Candidatus Bathyarchaeota archaeon]
MRSKSDELEDLKKTGLNWAILTCLHTVLSETRFDIPRSVNKDLEIARSIIETGCRSIKDADGLLSWVENRLVEKAVSLDNSVYWEELLWKAKEGSITRNEIEEVPFLEALARKYGFLSYCIPDKPKHTINIAALDVQH